MVTATATGRYWLISPTEPNSLSRPCKAKHLRTAAWSTLLKAVALTYCCALRAVKHSARALSPISSHCFPPPRLHPTLTARKKSTEKVQNSSGQQFDQTLRTRESTEILYSMVFCTEPYDTTENMTLSTLSVPYLLCILCAKAQMFFAVLLSLFSALTPLLAFGRKQTIQIPRILTFRSDTMGEQV